jgi:2-dehydro-3-deoxy-D-pentonate aldolase
MKDLRGVNPPIVIFFDEKGNVDINASKKQTDFLIKNGVNGIAYLGTSGEFFTLTMQEKKDYLKAMVDHVAGRVNVIAGVGDTSVVNTLELLNYVEEIGVDGVLIINPYYSIYSEEMVEAYYDKLAESTKLQIIFYNFPALTGYSLDAPLVARLAKKHKNIVGIKETVSDPVHVQSMTAIKKEVPDFIVFNAFENQSIGSYLAGAEGSINSTANFAPEFTVGMYKAFMAGDMEKACYYQEKLSKCMVFYGFSSPLYMGCKQAVYDRVLGENRYERLPALSLSSQARQNVRNALKELELI